MNAKLASGRLSGEGKVKVSLLKPSYVVYVGLSYMMERGAPRSELGYGIEVVGTVRVSGARQKKDIREKSEMKLKRRARA